MRRGSAAVAYRLASEGAGRAAVLARAAAFVAASPAGTGLLVELPYPDGSLQLVPGSVALARAIEALTRDFPGALRRERPRRAPSPPPRLDRQKAGRFLARTAEPRERRRPGERAVAGTPTVLPVPWAVQLPPEVWLGTQLHWLSTGAGKLRLEARYRLATAAGSERSGAIVAAAALAARTSLPAGFEGEVVWTRWSGWAGRVWRRGRPAWRSRATGLVLSPSLAPAWAEPLNDEPFPTPGELATHLVVLGASGSGKTTFLARLAARAIRTGEVVLLFDVHGDLAPAVAARLGGRAADRLLAIDASDPTGEGPGIAVLDGEAGSPEREAAFVVAALKRISAEGPELYWGFRLERIFETLVRVVQEEGGSLLDLYALLQDPRRREASRLATRSPVAAAFLDELSGILRRNPEFLWPAAARLSKVALSPALARVLAPSPEAALAIAAALRTRGRSIAVRLPTNSLGPEASAFAASLLLTRAYLELAEIGASARPVLLVLDEVTAFSPRLVGEILAEGRKFGIRAVVATQYPERLAPEVRQAAAASAGSHLVFRVPAAAAASTGVWVGMTEVTAGITLPGLPDGWAVAAPARGSLLPRLVVGAPPQVEAGIAAWSERLRVTRAEFDAGPVAGSGPLADEIDEAILLALFGAESPLPLARLVGTSAGIDAERAAARLERLPGLRRRRLVAEGPDGFQLTAAGARYLGATAEHGSSSEGIEHRRVLLVAFRIFARHGERLELLRQGRFDTRLPDARLRLVPTELRQASPAALRALLERRQRSWAWRYFGGRDVFVEAEVSGAERSERIRRDVAKAARAGTFLLVIVPDARRARRVRATLARLGTERRSWAVWTLARG